MADSAKKIVTRHYWKKREKQKRDRERTRDKTQVKIKLFFTAWIELTVQVGCEMDAELTIDRGHVTEEMAKVKYCVFNKGALQFLGLMTRTMANND